jgi:hypothetical protein
MQKKCTRLGASLCEQCLRLKLIEISTYSLQSQTLTRFTYRDLCLLSKAAFGRLCWSYNDNLPGFSMLFGSIVRLISRINSRP